MSFLDLHDFLIYKSWDRPIKEVKAYKVIETEKGYQIIVNALGIDKDDIEVKLLQDTLHINGKTVNEQLEFTNTVRYQFNVARITKNIKKVEYSLKNGLLLIDLLLEFKEKREIKVEYKG